MVKTTAAMVKTAAAAAMVRTTAVVMKSTTVAAGVCLLFFECWHFDNKKLAFAYARSATVDGRFAVAYAEVVVIVSGSTTAVVGGW
ncbi:unnamed protein product [Cuscuta epithymum]|uniref:Secreted protein n=1 Tax=Cuscuta epithymum TaxID=186058 RepID=A0AAV0F8U0_9ASTE|nr:unnamed protein product [Cuscuta epithymum]